MPVGLQFVDIILRWPRLIFWLAPLGLAKVCVVEAAEEVHLHHAAVFGDRAQHVVGHVARRVDQRAGRRVRRDDGSFGGGDCVPERLVGDVRDVDHHAQAVHLEHNLLAEIGEAVVVLDLGVVDVAGGVGPFVGVRPGERHVAHAEPVVIAQQVHVVLDRVAAFDAHERGEFVLAMGALDVGHGEGHHHAVGMMRRLLVDGIDEIERVAGEVALVSIGVDPDGKELRAEVAAAGFVEADVPRVIGIGRADVEVFVEKTLGRVGVGVDHDGGFLNRASLGADNDVR